MGTDDILIENTVSFQSTSQDGAGIAASDELGGRKAKAVIAAALRLIVGQSFQHASMEAIAREAGVSKATLYAYFPSKNKLFEHIIAMECRKICSSLIMPNLDHGLAEALWLFAKQYVRLFVDRDPGKIAFFHALFREAAQFPELARLMIESGPRADAARLASLMEEARRRNLLDIDDANLAAKHFLCLIRGDLPIENLLALPAPTDAEVSKTIEEGLAFFLRAYQRPAPSVHLSGPVR
jgi:TetR/AcrR family transcriptional regulator, mexJK operon transcriptional repressor